MDANRSLLAIGRGRENVWNVTGKAAVYVRIQLLLFVTDDRIILVCCSNQLKNRLYESLLLSITNNRIDRKKFSSKYSKYPNLNLIGNCTFGLKKKEETGRKYGISTIQRSTSLLRVAPLVVRPRVKTRLS